MTPNFSTVRKAGAAATVSHRGQCGLEVISEHMSHSQSTSEKCYIEVIHVISSYLGKTNTVNSRKNSVELVTRKNS